MKKLAALCTMGVFLVGATAAVAADEPAAAPAAAPAPAPIKKMTRPMAAPKANTVGSAVPAWEAKAADADKTYKGESLKGKPYGIVFVNSSCAACRGELAQLMALNFPDSFTMLVAAVDVKLDRTVKTYRDDLQLKFPILDDSKFALGKVFGIGFTPASVVVDKEGKVEFWGAGFTSESEADTIAAFSKYAK